MRGRMLANLVAFVVISFGLIGYGIVDLLGNPLQHSTEVSATFPNASGVAPNFGVVLRGVVVGSVSSVQLTRRGAKVEIALRPGVKVPADVVASIGLANDLGEQQVELTPASRAGRGYLRSGQVVPVRRSGVPVQVGRVIGTASRLLKSIGARQLNSLLATLGTGLRGEASNLQSIMVSSQQFSQEFLAYQRQFESLLSNSTPVMNALAGDGANLRRELSNTAVLANLLDHHRYNLVRLLENGARASTVANALLDPTRSNLACILHDFAALSANAASPVNLSNLSVGLATNHFFFGAVDHIAKAGPAESLFPGDPYNPHQLWLRTRLLLPPGSPPANQYPKATQLRPVRPGAACHTELGNGVAAAHQSAPQFPVAGTRYDYPTTSDAVVRGGADPARTTAHHRHYAHPSYTLTADGRPAGPAGPLAWVALLSAAAVGLCVLAPRRRRYRRVPATEPTRTRSRRREEP